MPAASFRTGRSSRAPSKGRSTEPTIARSAIARAKSPSASRCDGVKLGDRVATLAWNGYRHLETWYGITGHRRGLPYHQPAPLPGADRLDRQPRRGPRGASSDLTFVPLLEGLADQLAERRALCRPDGRGAHAGDPAQERRCLRGVARRGRRRFSAGTTFDENTAAGLCYTSGTTGDPKGVLYSPSLHRAALAVSAPGSTCFPIGPRRRSCRSCRCSTPTPGASRFCGPMTGAKLVMPGARTGRRLDLRAPREARR